MMGEFIQRFINLLPQFISEYESFYFRNSGQRIYIEVPVYFPIHDVLDLKTIQTVPAYGLLWQGRTQKDNYQMLRDEQGELQIYLVNAKTIDNADAVRLYASQIETAIHNGLTDPNGKASLGLKYSQKLFTQSQRVPTTNHLIYTRLDYEIGCFRSQ